MIAYGALGAGLLAAASAAARSQPSQQDAPQQEAPQQEPPPPAPFDLDLDAILAQPEGGQEEEATGAPDQNDALRERLDQFFAGEDPNRATGAAAAGPRPERAVIRVLDKVTARFTDLQVKLDEPVAFGALTLVARSCYKRPPEEPPETVAFLQIYETELSRAADHLPEAATISDGAALRLGIEDAAPERDSALPPIEEGPREAAVEAELANQADPAAAPAPSRIQAPAVDATDAAANPEASRPAAPAEFEIAGKKIFSGWMFASSPALNPLEHPVYDAWVMDCITAAPDN